MIIDPNSNSSYNTRNQRYDNHNVDFFVFLFQVTGE